MPERQRPDWLGPAVALITTLLLVGNGIALFVMGEIGTLRTEIGELKAGLAARKTFSDAKYEELDKRDIAQDKRLDNLERKVFGGQ